MGPWKENGRVESLWAFFQPDLLDSKVNSSQRGGVSLYSHPGILSLAAQDLR